MIDTEFLGDVAQYVNNRVVKIVLNGSYEITNFEQKTVTASTLALNYTVPVSEVALISRIELKDVSNKLITSNDVNVPITSDTRMLQTVEVKEVNEFG